MEKVIDTKEVVQKLNAGGFSSAHADEFCRLLGGRLKGSTTPLNFLLTYELLISDVEKAPGREVRNGPDGPVYSFIAGLPIGGVFRLMMRSVVAKVFPKEFADEIIREYEEMCAEMQAVGVR